MNIPHQDSHVRTIEIGSEFDLLGYPNGGYLASLAARILGSTVQHPDLLTLHASFLGHPASGAAQASTQVIDVKKSLSRASLLLSQEGEGKAFYTATFTEFERSAGLTHAFEARHPAPVAYAHCVPVTELGLPGALTDFLKRFDMRLNPGCMARPGPGQPAVVEGWIRLRDGQPADLESLVLFADAFPPPIFNACHPSQWASVPTVEYSVHLKARPCAGPIHARFSVPALVRGFIEIDGVLHDSEGQLVALSRQIAKFRGGLQAADGVHAG
jgi:hypothetical protein